MASELIKKHLEELKSQKKFDEGFIDILVEANETSEDGEAIAEKLKRVIQKQYAESKQNKS